MLKSTTKNIFISCLTFYSWSHINAICRLQQASNPLYLLVALSELRTLGGNDMNKIVPQLITSLDKEYPDTVSLFRWVLRRLEVFGKEAVSWWSLYLAHGRAGMSSHELVELLTRKLGPDAPLSALRIERGLRRYLYRRGSQLDFFHSQLRQAVIEQYGAVTEEADIHKDIALYFRDSADPQDDQTWNNSNPRAVSELPYHAWKANLRDLSYLLAEDDPFLKVQQRLIFEDPDLPLRTIRYAIDVACEVEEPVRMAEFTLKHANFLAQQSTETPLDALMNPDLPPQSALKRAWKLADLLDNQHRSYALLLLTWKLQQLQRNDEAAATLVRVEPEKIVKQYNLADLIILLLSQIRPMVSIDLTRIAGALLNDGSLLKFIKHLINNGQFAEALRTTGTIQLPFIRSIALRVIARHQAQAGQFEEALRITKKIEEVDPHYRALVAIVKAQAEAEWNPTEAFRVALQVCDTIQINRGKSLIDLSKAIKTLSRINKKSILKEFLSRAAYYIESAYSACGLVAHLYPSAAAEIAKLLGVGSASNGK